MKTLLISRDAKLKKIAENNFAEVLHANEKELGARSFEQNKFDLVIVDLAISRQDGLDLVDVIRRHDRSVPVMALTEDS